ncbi:MAG TPA: ATP-binding protein [Thermoanaerobaculia bacterium]|nr:ATP-binding protein [Thermoanaerobaculia bacterium]
MTDRRLHELLAINRAIAASLDYEEVLRLVVERCAELLGAETCALLLCNEEGCAEVAAHRGIDGERAAGFSASFDERIQGALRELLGSEPGDTFFAMPVIQKERIRGVLAVNRRGSDRQPDPEEHFLLGALADQAAIALDHASRYYELWQESGRAREQLEREARRKDEYLAMLAHELRNPLSAITNALAVVQTVLPDDPRLVDVSAAANRQAKLMARLLDDLLDVSRVTRGKINLDFSPVIVQEAVRQAVHATDALLRERRHRLSLTLPDEPMRVLGDLDRLVQVFGNLLTNAAKFSPPEGRIDVTVSSDEETGQVVVSIRDEGIGIEPDLLPSIFDLFVQADRTRDRREGGLGIGLTLVQRLVRMHGGEIEATSEGLGKGTEVIVRFPDAGAASTEGNADEEAPDASNGGGARSGRRVLLVEDDPDVAETMAAFLRHSGHRVAVAHDGPAALEAVRRAPPEVVLLDIGLPGMDGLEVAREIHRRFRADRPLLVALSGYGSRRDRARSREAGCDHHLVKPVQPEELDRLLAQGGNGTSP